MSYLPNGVLCCREREQLEQEWLEVRTRGLYLIRLRRLSRLEHAEWDRREQAALGKLADHDLEHGAGVEKLRQGERENRACNLKYELIIFNYCNVQRSGAGPRAVLERAKPAAQSRDS
jgi:hypothetical protein